MSATLLLTALAVTGGANFQALLDRMRSDQEVPGISAVVSRGDQVIFAGASGLADIETQREMSADTLVYAGSLSKVFTAVLILRLVEEGKLDLSDTVAGIAVTSSGDTQDITVEHLLTHASGLEREGDFGYWFSADFPGENELKQYLRHTTLRTPPGRDLHYSNIGYATLGMVAAGASGRHYGEALRTQLLLPLGMVSSGTMASVPGISAGYTPVGRIIPSEERPFAGVGRAVGDRHIREYHDAKAMSPAFGIYTSANDLARLARFVLGHGPEGVLSAAMRQRMGTKQASGWGLGMRIGELNGNPVVRHGGWFAAHRSHLLLDVNADLSVVVMTNSDSGVPAEIAEALYELALTTKPRKHVAVR